MTPQPPKNYYKTLGLPRDATREDVKRAYRELAREWHPDVNAAADAAKRFKEITEAYDVLRDAAKRRAYDLQTANVNPETSVSNAARMRQFINRGGTPTLEMLSEALHDNNDPEMARILLGAGLVPDEGILMYAVRHRSAYCVALLINHGAKPTPEMLAEAVKLRKPYTAKVLLESRVPPTLEAARLVKEELQPRGWSGQKSAWESELSAAFRKEARQAGVSFLRSFFSGPKKPGF